MKEPDEKGLLLVLVDPAPALEEELNDWYDTEHLPERAAIEGFETARRFTSLGDGPRYLAIYDLRSLDVLAGAEYRAVSGSNFSPWTKRITGRTHPVRLTAKQVGAEQSVTGRCSRLMLLKFQEANYADTPAISAGLAASFEGVPGFLKARVFAGVEPDPDFVLALVEFSGGNVPPLRLEAFGSYGKVVVLAATYRPYRG